MKIGSKLRGASKAGLFFAFTLLTVTATATELKVTTYNAGFLDFLGLKTVWVPDYEPRLNEFEYEFLSYLEAEQPDVVSLQEVWREDAAEKIRFLARENGYISIAEILEKNPYFCGKPQALEEEYSFDQHGLDILVRDDSDINFRVIGCNFTPFKTATGSYIRAWTTGLVPGVVRGALSVKIKKDEKLIEVFNSHFTPVIGSTSIRAEQGIALSNIVNQSTAEVVAIAADLNFSDNFAFSVEGRKQEGTADEWQKNAELYGKLMDLTQMIDSYRAIHPDLKGFTQDRLNNDLADVSDSTKNEPEQRIDYVLLRTNGSITCEVEDSQLVFTQPIIRDGVALSSHLDASKRLFLSDHFGVQSQFTCE